MIRSLIAVVLLCGAASLASAQGAYEGMLSESGAYVLHKVETSPGYYTLAKQCYGNYCTYERVYQTPKYKWEWRPRPGYVKPKQETANPGGKCCVQCERRLQELEGRVADLESLLADALSPDVVPIGPGLFDDYDVDAIRDALEDMDLQSSARPPLPEVKWRPPMPDVMWDRPKKVARR